MLTVTFTQDELTALASLLDIAVKATGLQGARAALPLIDKLEKAVAAANAPQPQEQETE
jgi:predicted DNA-binding transcriptional regulator YafY